VGLSCQVDQDSPVRLRGGGLHHGVEAFESVRHDRRGIAGVEAKQGGMGLVGVEAEKGDPPVDEVLGEQAGDDRLPHAALLAPDEVNVCHGASRARGR